MVNPSPEVCKRVVSFLHPYATRDLKALCLVSKAFERATRPVLFRQVILTDFPQVIAFGQCIRENPELGKMILEFRVMGRHQLRFSPEQRVELYALHYWNAVADVLARAPNLNALIIYDPLIESLPPLRVPQEEAYPFQLERCGVKLWWNDAFLEFLVTQHRLVTLQLYEPYDERDNFEIPANCWPNLTNFSGTLVSALEIAEGAAPNVRHMCMRLDDATSPTIAYCMPQLASLRKTLRSLKLAGLEPGDVENTLAAIARNFPDLQYIGALPLPVLDRTAFLSSLTAFPDLRHLQVDLTRWRPQPHAQHALRAIVTQLKAFAPSLRMVTLWVPQGKWMYHIRDGEWEGAPDGTQSIWQCNSWMEQVSLEYLPSAWLRAHQDRLRPKDSMKDNI
ncbi:hypothetical protein GGF50DRAFT_51198 [Schizophyllum commune]